ncbi:HAD-superfamily subfamily IB hydrolase, TIGR01490 [Nannocystis exedens]|uniref:HAD-superfamily subfamily IB hydrolase, TIGR01490 n=1 Tax=Nannocystis exedens TaxID=54 RepID=A0A1I2DAI2_9BACT|nr:HAD family hydrolase [Nannocystis exedens]PCC70628.1 Phosphoserine phosphatase [Nannocystis exedens]SFE77441.1 HAD-superfamily subfamily IB hydrolase, TIGR01490 [Nannocystis exedens]
MTTRPEPNAVGAFFDVDHTLLAVNSAVLWVRYQRRIGKMSAAKALRSLTWVVRYRLSLLDLEAMTTKAVRDYAGVPVAEVEAETRAWFEAEIVRWICPEGQARVARHRRDGHVVALLSSGTRFSVEPLAERLGVEHVLCTRLEEQDGVLTGKHVAPACAGPGKVVLAEKFAAEHDIDLSRSYFYTDSFSDLPMLERVGRPQVVSPDPRLLRRARALGWPIERWQAA